MTSHVRGLSKVVGLPKSIDQFVEGMTMSPTRWLQLIEDSHALRERFKAAFDRYNVILAPPTMTTDLPHDDSLFAARKLTIGGPTNQPTAPPGVEMGGAW